MGKAISSGEIVMQIQNS